MPLLVKQGTQPYPYPICTLFHTLSYTYPTRYSRVLFLHCFNYTRAIPVAIPVPGHVPYLYPTWPYHTCTAPLNWLIKPCPIYYTSGRMVLALYIWYWPCIWCLATHRTHTRLHPDAGYTDRPVSTPARVCHRHGMGHWAPRPSVLSGQETWPK